MKGLERFRLLDAHQLTSFLLDVPKLHVREHLERGAVAIVQAPGPCGHSAHAAGRPSEKADQAVRLAQWKCLQDDGFRFPGRHELSACRRCVERIAAHRSKRTHTRNYCKYHTRTRGAISAWRIQKNLAEGQCVDLKFPKAMHGFL